MPFMLRMLRYNTLWVQADIFESDLAFIHLGTLVEITVDA